MNVAERICPDCEGKFKEGEIKSVYFTGPCLICNTCAVICHPDTGAPVMVKPRHRAEEEKLYYAGGMLMTETELHLSLVGIGLELEEAAGAGTRSADMFVDEGRTMEDLIEDES